MALHRDAQNHTASRIQLAVHLYVMLATKKLAPDKQYRVPQCTHIYMTLYWVNILAIAPILSKFLLFVALFNCHFDKYVPF